MTLHTVLPQAYQSYHQLFLHRLFSIFPCKSVSSNHIPMHPLNLLLRAQMFFLHFLHFCTASGCTQFSTIHFPPCTNHHFRPGSLLFLNLWPVSWRNNIKPWWTWRSAAKPKATPLILLKINMKLYLFNFYKY